MQKDGRRDVQTERNVEVWRPSGAEGDVQREREARRYAERQVQRNRDVCTKSERGAVVVARAGRFIAVLRAVGAGAFAVLCALVPLVQQDLLLCCVYVGWCVCCVVCTGANGAASFLLLCCVHVWLVHFAVFCALVLDGGAGAVCLLSLSVQHFV